MFAVSGPLPRGEGWCYELKWDGLRAIAEVNGATVRLFSRNGTEITAAYPELTSLTGVGRDAVLDGEIVALDRSGRPSFAALAERMHVRDPRRAVRLAGTVPVTYMIFDLLRYGGRDLTGRPYRERRAALERLPAVPGAVVPPSFPDGAATLAAAAEHDLEGVVAKRCDAPYRPGRRTSEWIKVKRAHTGDFLVGGWRPGARALGALLVGEPGPGGLAFRGRVGGGISRRAEADLLAALAPLRADACPFVDLPAPERRDVTWVRPELVVEVRYGQRTPDGRLRFPSFARIRPDKSPAEVTGGPPAEVSRRDDG